MCILLFQLVPPDVIKEPTTLVLRYDKHYTLTMAVKHHFGEERSANFTKSVGDFFDENGSLTDNFEGRVMELHRSLEKGKKAQ